MARSKPTFNGDGHGNTASASGTGAYGLGNGHASAPATVRTEHPPSTGATTRPTTEEIRKRAYELYCARKGRGGTPEDDWFRAERELFAKRTAR